MWPALTSNQATSSAVSLPKSRGSNRNLFILHFASYCHVLEPRTVAPNIIHNYSHKNSGKHPQLGRWQHSRCSVVPPLAVLIASPSPPKCSSGPREALPYASGGVKTPSMGGPWEGHRSILPRRERINFNFNFNFILRMHLHLSNPIDVVFNDCRVTPLQLFVAGLPCLESCPSV